MALPDRMPTKQQKKAWRNRCAPLITRTAHRIKRPSGGGREHGRLPKEGLVLQERKRKIWNKSLDEKKADAKREEYMVRPFAHAAVLGFALRGP